MPFHFIATAALTLGCALFLIVHGRRLDRTPHVDVELIVLSDLQVRVLAALLTGGQNELELAGDLGEAPFMVHGELCALQRVGLVVLVHPVQPRGADHWLLTSEGRASLFNQAEMPYAA